MQTAYRQNSSELQLKWFEVSNWHKDIKLTDCDSYWPTTVAAILQRFKTGEFLFHHFFVYVSTHSHFSRLWKAQKHEQFKTLSLIKNQDQRTGTKSIRSVKLNKYNIFAFVLQLATLPNVTNGCGTDCFFGNSEWMSVHCWTYLSYSFSRVSSVRIKRWFASHRTRRQAPAACSPKELQCLEAPQFWHTGSAETTGSPNSQASVKTTQGLYRKLTPKPELAFSAVGSTVDDSSNSSSPSSSTNVPGLSVFSGGPSVMKKAVSSPFQLMVVSSNF